VPNAVNVQSPVRLWKHKNPVPGRASPIHLHFQTGANSQPRNTRTTREIQSVRVFYSVILKSFVFLTRFSDRMNKMHRMKRGILFSESVLNPVNPVHPVRLFLGCGWPRWAFRGKKILGRGFGGALLPCHFPFRSSFLSGTTPSTENEST
jgi:hypothetical protein